MSVPTPILQYNLSDASVKGLLPSGYTPLAYVEFINANRLINTGITPNNNLKFESKWGNLTNGGLLYGSENSSDISSYASTSSGYNWRWGGLAPSPTPVVDTGIFIVELSKDEIKINGVIKSTYSGTPSFTNTAVYLFGRSDSSSYYLTGRCYYFKIWNNGSLVRDFIPCINSSNVVGLYDLVGRLFYSPSSNVLIAGPELAIGKGGGKSLPEEYLLVEYLEGTGSLEINTGYTYDSTVNTYRVKCRFKMTGVHTAYLAVYTAYSGEAYNDWRLIRGNADDRFLITTNAKAGGNNNSISVSSIFDEYTIDHEYSSYTLTNLNTGVVYSNTNLNHGNGTDTTHAMTLFSSSKCRISEFKLYTGSTLVRNMIPCYRKSDMKPGMYDTVNEVFYTNAGSGEFILGPSITNCYTWEPNAGSGTLQGLYTNLSGIYDSNKGWIADFTNNTAHLSSTIPAIGNNFSVIWWELSSDFNGSTMPWGIYPFNPFFNRCLNTSDSNNNPWYLPGTTTQVTAISNNVWHHFAVTGNGTTNYLYIDGVLYGQSKTFKGLTGTSLVMNGWKLITNYCRNPKICNFMIFDSALTAAQVKELYGK